VFLLSARSPLIAIAASISLCPHGIALPLYQSALLQVEAAGKLPIEELSSEVKALGQTVSSEWAEKSGGGSWVSKSAGANQRGQAAGADGVE